MDLFRPFHPLAGCHRRYCCWCCGHQQEEVIVPQLLVRILVMQYMRAIFYDRLCFSASHSTLDYPLAPARLEGRDEPYTSTCSPSLMYLLLTLRPAAVISPGVFNNGFPRAFLFHARQRPTFTNFTVSLTWHWAMLHASPSVGQLFARMNLPPIF